jgi:hypothetical protein
VALGPEPEKLAGIQETSFLAAGPGRGAAFKNDEDVGWAATFQGTRDTLIRFSISGAIFEPPA